MAADAPKSFRCTNSTSLHGECPMMFFGCHEIADRCLHPEPKKPPVPLTDEAKTPYPCRCACGCRRDTYFGLLCVECRAGGHQGLVKEAYRQTTDKKEDQ